jgi:AcrR family transcriptional regulator
MYTKSKQTIQTILEAARSLFIEKNYADVTIAEIVASAEVSKGALYHHFSSKEDLYLRMMHHFLAEIQETTEAVADNSTGHCRQRLKESTLNFLRLSDELLSILRLVRRDINIFQDPMRNELIRAYQKAVPEQVERIIRDGIANGELMETDARILSWELVALVEVILRPYSRNKIGDAEAMCEFVIRLFFDGVVSEKNT